VQGEGKELRVDSARPVEVRVEVGRVGELDNYLQQPPFGSVLEGRVDIGHSHVAVDQSELQQTGDACLVADGFIGSVHGVLDRVQV
jgi:hypothetical protein